MRFIFPSIFVAALMVPHLANACGASPNLAIVHLALPNPLPAGAFIADVEIETRNARRLYAGGLRARVRRAIAGASPGERIILRLTEESSCDAPFVNGRSGLLVGIPRNREHGALVVWPLLVSRYDGFRLPDGFQLLPQALQQRSRVISLPAQ